MSPVEPLIVMSIAKGVMISDGSGHMLKVNGGFIELNLEWARSIITDQLKWTKRKATTSRKMTTEEKRATATKMKKVVDRSDLYHPDLL